MQGTEGESHLRVAAAGGDADWTAQARPGLHIMLQSKVGPAQRQALLQLTSALAQIASPVWLLASLGTQPCTRLTGCLPHACEVQVASLLPASQRAPFVKLLGPSKVLSLTSMHRRVGLTLRSLPSWWSCSG